jgi:hypothetical protein
MSGRRRLSPGTARAIDRLAARAHAFHRFAHHPLCDRYAGELVRLGRRARVCRGCLAVGLGGVAGAGLGSAQLPGSALVGLLALAALLVLASLVVRLPKTLGRFVPALGAGAGLASALEHGAGDVALAVVGCLALFFVLYRRRRPNRAPCATCPERERLGACSGFSAIVRRERAFQRVAQRMIDRERAAERRAWTGVEVAGARSAP